MPDPIKYTDPDRRAGKKDDSTGTTIEVNVNKERITTAINKIANSEFGKANGEIVSILNELNANGQIAIRKLSPDEYAKTLETSHGNTFIFVADDVPDDAIPGRLVHEGTHVHNIRSGMPKSLNDERMAFDTAFIIDKELGSSVQENPSNEKLAEMYSNLKWLDQKE
jgi:hypothetical protein